MTLFQLNVQDEISDVTALNVEARSNVTWRREAWEVTVDVLEKPATSVFKARCPEGGDEQLLVNVDNHIPKHTASHPKDHIFFRYIDVSGCKANVITWSGEDWILTVRSLCRHLLGEIRQEHKVCRCVVYTREEASCFVSYSTWNIIRVVRITPLNNPGKSGTLYVTTFFFFAWDLLAMFFVY